MRLFLYYSLHSLKNQLKKLFRTWVMIFILICAVIGGAIGFGAAVLTDIAEEKNSEISSEAFIPDEEYTDSEEDLAGLDEPDPDAEEISVDFFGSFLDRIETTDFMELVIGLILLIMFFYEAFSADTNGSKIFLPADVNILFASPMKPQSVLMFRLMTQLGMILFASIYLLFQLPNLVLNVGMSTWAAVSLLAAWILTVMTGKLLQLLLYTICSTNPRIKERLRPVLYSLITLLLLGCGFFWKKSGLSLPRAVVQFFNAKGTRLIPFWGWIKGFCMYAVEDNPAGTLGSLAAVIAGMGVLIYVIWHIKADFYEDAMHKTEEMAELMAKVQSEESSGLIFVKRKKDRSEKLRRDNLNHGWGANVFFFKSLYNRFRFARLGIFTKTAVTYLAAAVIVSLAAGFILEAQDSGLTPVAITLGVLVFFRSLGNPLEEDTKMDFFRLIPESAWSKVFWSLLGGTVNCLLDLLPAFLAAVLLLQENPLKALTWILVILSVDFYATNVGVFINLSVPVSAGKTIKQIIQFMFIYFGLLPDIALLAICTVFLNLGIGAAAATIFNIGLGFLFFAFSPIFLEPKGGN